MRRDPDRIAANILPEAASANRAIFYGRPGARSLAEVYDRFSDKLADHGAAAGSPPGAPPDSPPGATKLSPYGLGAGAIAARGGFVPSVPGGSPTEYATRMFMAKLSLPGEPGAIG